MEISRLGKTQRLPAYDRRFIRTATPGIILMDGRAGATLSLNVLSFQTSFETWTTAAIINWKKLLRLSVVSKLEETNIRLEVPQRWRYKTTGKR